MGNLANYPFPTNVVRVLLACGGGHPWKMQPFCIQPFCSSSITCHSAVLVSLANTLALRAIHTARGPLAPLCNARLLLATLCLSDSGPVYKAFLTTAHIRFGRPVPYWCHQQVPRA